MKLLKTILIILIINFIPLIKVFAHEDLIDIELDECINREHQAGMHENWFSILKPKEDEIGYWHFHLDEEVDTIYYYFHNDTSEYSDYNLDDYSWTTDTTEEVAEEIKSAIVESMLKWNKVYFYTYNNNNIIQKRKIINILPGTKENHNLSIYPVSIERTDAYATTYSDDSFDDWYSKYEVNNNINHAHPKKWIIEINVREFFPNTYTEVDSEGNIKTRVITTQMANKQREQTPAHEIGHVLGLYDIDLYCSASNEDYHHNEVLMGYEDPKCDNITYRDLAGVAITRGFHTSQDHKWLIDWNYDYENNGYKIICSICNGVKYVSNTSGLNIYNTYGQCDGSHTLSSGNMFAVGCYEDKDYYKCKYCRYVANFNSIVSQIYNYEYYDSSYHLSISNTGLEYSLLQKHIYQDLPVYINLTQHSIACSCGDRVIRGHAVATTDTTRCIICGGRVSSGILGPLTNEIILVTNNGSYILPNGIVVLVEVDIQAYLNDNLIFFDKNTLII